MGTRLILLHGGDGGCKLADDVDGKANMETSVDDHAVPPTHKGSPLWQIEELKKSGSVYVQIDVPESIGEGSGLLFVLLYDGTPKPVWVPFSKIHVEFMKLILSYGDTIPFAFGYDPAAKGLHRRVCDLYDWMVTFMAMLYDQPSTTHVHPGSLIVTVSFSDDDDDDDFKDLIEGLIIEAEGSGSN